MTEEYPFYTCKFCSTKVFIKEKYTPLYCICKQFGIFYTKDYVKFLGSVPVEYENKTIHIEI